MEVTSEIIKSIDASDVQVQKHRKKNKHNKISKNGEDKVDVNMEGIYKSLKVTADEVVKKINELLGNKVPGGVESLRLEDYTAEKTSDTIVKGITSLLPIYARQNPELEGEDLINKFMEEVGRGVAEGAASAKQVLGDIGAFEFDGVESGVDDTIRLVYEKLNAFKEQYLADNGFAKESPSSSATPAPQQPEAPVDPIVVS